MKKSKKALLWTIVPVLGVSSGVAGAVAGVTNQKTSVDTNNVATPGSATTMATRSSSGVANKLKIERQSYDVTNFAGETNTVYVSVSGSENLRYEWFVNKDGTWSTYIGGGGVPSAMVKSPETSTVLNWTFKCVITDIYTKESVTSEDIKFTTLPSDGRYIRIEKQPTFRQTFVDGDEVTLTTKAVPARSHSSRKIGYQWFEYNSNTNTFSEIQDANTSEYKFTAKYVKGQETKKYVCKYYFEDQPKKYLNESNQSIVTIEKGEKEIIVIDSLKASSNSIKVGDITTLSVKARSSKTKNLEYQWYKANDDGRTFEMIKGATTAEYNYQATKDDVNKELIFCVLVRGTIQYGMQNYFQSGNLYVNVTPSVDVVGTVDKEISASEITVTSKVSINQASVRSNFYPNTSTKIPSYSVEAKGAEGLSYQWYYVGRDGKEHKIDGATTSTLTTNQTLFEKAYKDNSNHKVDIVCKIYSGNKLIKTVDKSVNSSFYLSVVITNRRVSRI